MKRILMASVAAIALCLSFLPGVNASAAVPTSAHQQHAVSLNAMHAAAAASDNPEFASLVDIAVAQQSQAVWTTKGRATIYTVPFKSGGDIQVVQEPPGRKVGITPDMSFSVGFFTVYVHLTPMEQEMAIDGSGAALGVAICSATALLGCAAAAAVVAMVAVYLAHHPICSYRMQIGIGYHQGVKCQ